MLLIQFFKPTIYKIILALVILVFLPASLNFGHVHKIDGSVNNLNTIEFTYDAINNFLIYHSISPWINFIFFFSIIIAYLFSCTVILLKNKITRRIAN